MALTSTSGADNISGDNNDNTIDGLGGNDTIQGLLGKGTKSICRSLQMAVRHLLAGMRSMGTIWKCE